LTFKEKKKSYVEKEKGEEKMTCRFHEAKKKQKKNRWKRGNNCLICPLPVAALITQD